ncbi:MAG TPA: AmmeMemoRadiSam system protein B, partial [bacterium (Candidatus Stahlbacteria)]|nr:AmmeMemoRadiSam system protein B [Candidatus Stahlbacteria bacterium]
SVALLAHLGHHGKELDRIVVIGPSHQSYFTDPVVDNRSSWVTPLGEIMVDQEGVSVLIESGLRTDANPFDIEHSLEVQVPFIQYLSPGTKILPVMIGDQNLDACKRVAQAIGRLEGKTFVIASSDLYHGYSYDECRKTDDHTIATILHLDPEKLSQELEANRAMACGGGPIISLIIYSKSKGVKQASVLKYTNSNDVMGVKGGYCVGYVAIGFLK